MRRSLALLLVLLAASCGPSPAPDAALDHVQELVGCGKLDEARTALDELWKAHPADTRVALRAGEIATWRGFPDEGLVWLERAAALTPADPEPHLRTAYLLLVHPPDGVPEVDAALQQAEQALADAGGIESADYRACRGEAAWAAGDEPAAERWFRGALELRADCRWALHRMLQIVGTRGASAESERADLHERLARLINEGRTGQGMENARMPASFCGH